MTTDQRCRTCKHWDHGTIADIEEARREDPSYQESADWAACENPRMQMKLTGVTGDKMVGLLIEDDVIEAAEEACLDINSSLYVHAEFGCVLWEGKS